MPESPSSPPPAEDPSKSRPSPPDGAPAQDADAKTPGDGEGTARAGTGGEAPSPTESETERAGERLGPPPGEADAGVVPAADEPAATEGASEATAPGEKAETGGGEPASDADRAALPAKEGEEPARSPAAQHDETKDAAPATEEAAGKRPAVPVEAEPDPGTPAAEAPDAKEGEGPARSPAAERAAPRKRRRAPLKARRPTLDAAQRAEAREAARKRLLARARRSKEKVAASLDRLEDGQSIVFLARFRRVLTDGMDERVLADLQEAYEEALRLEERRIELREMLRQHDALDEETAERLRRANTVAGMEDLAAPHLPVPGGRAMVARAQGLQGLADAIRAAEPGSLLSDLAKPFVREGGPPGSLDEALAGARDILAEEISLNAPLRGRLRKVVRKEAVLTVAARSDKKGGAGRHQALVGFQVPVTRLPPLKFLAIRHGEKDRALVASIEPPEEKVLPLVQEAACAADHPHAGFVRAAAEDGYRRILKPLFQAEVRHDLKDRADRHAFSTFERNLRNRLLGPVGGPRRTLGLRPDVVLGHRWCAVDADGLPTGCGQLPHEPTAGREACVAELREILKTYEVQVIAVGSGSGRREAMSLAEEAVQGHAPPIDVAVVPDGGTRLLEGLERLTFDDRPDLPPEARGALSLARRFQDPLAEMVGIDPKTLGLGPHLHDVHQGRLRRLLDRVVESCVARVGVDPNRAGEELLARLPGMNRTRAQAFRTWREAYGALRHKAALAAVPGVGTEAAEQAVGFLRLPDAQDPRDRTQLHPEQYGMVEKMAEQVGCDLKALFTDPTLRSRVRLKDLEGPDAPLPVLKYVLYQVTAGHQDERPRVAAPIPPPEGLTLEILQPGLVLEGRVVRAVPFGVFVDVGLGTEALVPNAHIGSHPGIDPATVAPVGAVIQARVLEVIPEKKRLTLTMRVERPPPRDRRRGPRPAPGERREGPPRGERPARGDRGRGRGERPRRKAPQRRGKYEREGLGDLFSGRRRTQERGVPRHISLEAGDEPRPQEAAEESELSEEELLKRKLADLQRKFGGSK